MKGFISSRGGNLLSINAWVKACHVMVIYLFFGLFWVGGVVAQPSIVESSATIPRNEVPKLSNSDLQIRECGLEESVNVSRPIGGGGGIESTKLSKNSGTELSRGGIVSIKPDVSEPAKNGDESANESDELLAQFTVILVIIMNIGFLTTLNA